MFEKLPVWEAVLTLIVVALVVPPTDARAQPLSAIPAAFLDAGPGPRHAALGHAGVASDLGLEAVWANPASAATLDEVQFSFSYLQQYDLLEHGQFGLGFSARGGWGLGLHFRDSGDDAMRETVVQMALARRFGRLSVGLSSALLLSRFGRNQINPDALVVFDPIEISEGMANQISGDATGVTGGIGVRYAAGRAAIGISARNLASLIRWNSGTASGSISSSYNEGLPFALVIGGQIPAGRHGLILLDYVPALDDELDERIRAGIQVTLAELLSLRAGTERSLNGQSDERLTLGFGLRLPAVAGVTLAADYAYADSFLGTSQQVALRVAF